MKQLKYTLLFFIVGTLFSCSHDESSPPAADELDEFILAETLVNEQHQIGLYTETGIFQTGYNAIYFQIKNADGTLVSNATATWDPVMTMTGMSHSCPASAITKKENAQTTYAGYIVFQMANNTAEHWSLTLHYTINGTSYNAAALIDVSPAPTRTLENFEAADGNRYVLAMVAPKTARVGINQMQAVLYRMENMLSFTPVENYTIKIDPRMPGMANHGSPNNVDLTQSADLLYHGNLSLTMTGYWRINLQLADTSGNVIKGEPVTDANPESSIYFEVEF